MTQIASIVYRPIGQPNPKDDYLRLDLDDATLVAGYGIEGDAKGGHPDRQLNVMSYETLTILRGQGFYTEPGQMGEQIVIHQLDVDAFTAGAKVQLGTMPSSKSSNRVPVAINLRRCKRSRAPWYRDNGHDCPRSPVAKSMGDPVRVIKDTVVTQ
jgi:hypothetical protein